jgi:hypothetical protein
MRRAFRHASHVQAGVQVAPGWQLQAEPHLQAGPQTQNIPLLSVVSVMTAECESGALSVEFM